MAAHTKLKTRSTAPKSRAEVIAETLAKLEKAEGGGAHKREVRESDEEAGRLRLENQTEDVDVNVLQKYGDEDDDAPQQDEHYEDDSSSDEDSSDDEEEDEAALMAELAKVKREREEAATAAKRKAEEEELARLSAGGNPLLNPYKTGQKRKWNDDVVFRNQAKGEGSREKEFVNDTTRNAFHKRFLDKYCR